MCREPNLLREGLMHDLVSDLLDAELRLELLLTWALHVEAEELAAD
ncbi:hypothetical protein Misp01_51920 [Microtetraspora sp. NBRC 13810]|nr:hypothetical protein Misp01_51920 [Microtetraspora sp. NBRC 13810]